MQKTKLSRLCRSLIVALASATLIVACGDDEPSKNNGTPVDTGVDMAEEDMGGGGDDMGEEDMGQDMAEEDMGQDMAEEDMGQDMAGDVGQDMAGDAGQDMAGDMAGDVGQDMADMAPDMGDPCANVNCPQPADTCDVDGGNPNTAVTYSGDGTCVVNNGQAECDYSAVSNTTDCTNNSQICVNAACVDDDDASVGPGDLVITEVMQDPAAVGDSDGEYFEVFNTTNRTLDLQGLELTDAGSNSYTVPTGTAIDLAGRSYFVFGKNDSSADNGGITVDHAFGGSFSLSNSDDEIIITNMGGTEVDRVEWDGRPNWPDPTGASMQWGAQHDRATGDNNVGDEWCWSYTQIGSGDYGTPGAANDMCDDTPFTRTVYEIQDDTDANYPGFGRLVEVQGVSITAVNNDGDMFVQETAGGMYSGIYVDGEDIDTSVLSRDEVITITGTYVEYFDRSQIIAESVTSSTTSNTLTAELVDSDDLRDAATAEPWEGVLITLNEAGVTAAKDSFNEFGLDGAVLSDDMFYDPAGVALCDLYDTFAGPLDYSFSNFKLQPRDGNDVGAVTTNTLVSGTAGAVTIPGLSFNPETLCVSAGATVTWTNSDTNNHTVTERDETMADSAASNPDFDHSLSTGQTASETFGSADTVHYICTLHAAQMQGRIIVVE